MTHLQQRCNKDSRPLRRRSRTLAYLLALSLASGAASGRIEAQGIKISALPAASSASAGDELPVNQAGTTRKLTPAQMLALLTGGPGIGISAQTISTASSEVDFLTSGALTCGAATQGKVQTHSTTPLQYCDNAATPTLRYAAYGNATGECTAAANDSVVLSTDTTGNYAASSSEGGPATSVAANSVALGTDTTGGYAASATEGGAASSVAANSVTLTTDTVGNYAAGDGEAGNATGLVCTTCVGATDIADDAVTEPKLKAVDSATDEECLTFETTTGDFEWQACGAGGGIGGTLDATDNAVTRADGTGGSTAQGSALAIEDYVSTSPASDYVSVTPFGADSIISTRLNYVGGNGSPGVYGAGILVNGTAVGFQASGSYFKTWDGGGGNAPIFIGSRIAFTGLTSGHVAIRSTSDPGIEVVAGDDSAFATFKSKHITADGSFRAVAQTLTIADNGTGSAATGTLTFTRSLAKCDCGDANGCDVTLSETGMVDGWQWTVVNISANPCNFADTSGISELPAGGVALGQWDSLSGYYVTDRFVLTSTSNN